MGQHKRDFIYVDDIANGTFNAIFRKNKKIFKFIIWEMVKNSIDELYKNS